MLETLRLWMLAHPDLVAVAAVFLIALGLVGACGIADACRRIDQARTVLGDGRTDVEGPQR